MSRRAVSNCVTFLSHPVSEAMRFPFSFFPIPFFPLSAQGCDYDCDLLDDRRVRAIKKVPGVEYEKSWMTLRNWAAIVVSDRNGDGGEGCTGTSMSMGDACLVLSCDVVWWCGMSLSCLLRFWGGGLWFGVWCPVSPTALFVLRCVGRYRYLSWHQRASAVETRLGESVLRQEQ